MHPNVQVEIDSGQLAAYLHMLRSASYFVVLCPALAHAEQRVTLSYETWTGRGWLGEAKQIARCPLKCRKGGISLMLLLLCTWSEFP